MKRIKVRFHLSKGKNFMKWQIKYPNGIIEYYAPTETQLVLRGTTVKNHKKVAETIFNGGNKTVCAWVLCDSLELLDKAPFIQADNKDQSNRLRYNPRVKPNWVYEDRVVDGVNFMELVSVDRGLYVTKIS